MDINIEEIEYHRNGVGGRPFSVVKFSYEGDQLVAVIPSEAEEGECFVLDVNKAAEGNIGFGNKWRGDQFMSAILASEEWKAHDK